MADDKLTSRSAPAETLWFIARGETMKGPYTLTQVSEKVANKEISSLDYCWRQGFSEWRPVNSVEEFDRRGRLKSLSLYPSVAVPGQTPPRLSEPVSEKIAPQEGESKFRLKAALNKREKIEVTFAKVRRGPLSIYEWAAALVFCLVFSYFAVVFALNEVEKKVFEKLAWIEMGSLKREGFVPVDYETPERKDLTPLWMWEPLQSAPGIHKIQEAERPDPWVGTPSIPKIYVSHYSQVIPNELLHDGKGQRAPASEIQSEDHDDENISKFSAGFTQYRGYLDFSEGLRIKVQKNGSPEIP